MAPSPYIFFHYTDQANKNCQSPMPESFTMEYNLYIGINIITGHSFNCSEFLG